MQREYLDEKINIRCFYLRILKNFWAVLLAGAAGAAIAFCAYSAYVYTAQKPVYHADAEIYLHFVENASNDRVYNYYNAYTWKDLLLSDKISSLIEAKAKDEAFRKDILNDSERSWLETDEKEDSFSKAEQESVFTVDMPSDIRVLWVSANSEDEVYASIMTKAAAYALVDYGDINYVFNSIEILSIREPHLREYTDRKAVASVFGLITGLATGLIALILREACSDAVYVPEDAEIRYSYPVQMILPAEKYTMNDMPELFLNEAYLSAEKLLEKGVRWQIIISDKEADGEDIEKTIRKLISKKDMEKKLPAFDITIKNVLSEEEDIKEDGDFDVRLIAISMGRSEENLIKHIISVYKARESNVNGLIFKAADLNFLKRLYKI